MHLLSPRKHTNNVREQTARSKVLLLTSILSGAALVATVVVVSPQSEFILLTYHIQPLYLFLTLLFCFFFSFSSFLFKNNKHGLLIALFVLSYLVFRLNNLTHPFFFILLVALFLTLELFFSHRKDPSTNHPGMHE